MERNRYLSLWMITQQITERPNNLYRAQRVVSGCRWRCGLRPADERHLRDDAGEGLTNFQPCAPNLEAAHLTALTPCRCWTIVHRQYLVNAVRLALKEIRAGEQQPNGLLMRTTGGQTIAEPTC